MWLGMGVQGIGVRGVPGSIPGGGGSPLLMLSVSNNRLDRQNWKKVLGLMLSWTVVCSLIQSHVFLSFLVIPSMHLFMLC